MECFTSITYNYLPRARILAKTLKKHHPTWAFHVVISEALDPTINLENEPFDSFISIKQLNIENISSWLFKHDITEACTAIKGWAFEHIMKKYDAQKVIYLDPDIAVLNSLQELETLLDTFPIILIPHQTEPNIEPKHHFHDNNFLRCGVYNLGFLALNYEGQGKEFLNWWKERTTLFCYDESPLGLFTDQRWCDLAPIYFDRVHILRDPGYNVSPWNISNRRFSRKEDGTLYVNNSILRFFHFSRYGGLNYEYSARAHSSDDPIVSKLVDWYKKELEKNGQHNFEGRDWFYNRFSNGELISKKMRRYYRERPEMEEYFPDPFDIGLDTGFLPWWQNNDLDHHFQDLPCLVEYLDRPCKISVDDVEQLYDKVCHTIRKLPLPTKSSDIFLPEVSIIIPYSGKSASTIECILSICNSEKIIKYEIIVIGDNINIDFNSLSPFVHIKSIFIEEKAGIPEICNRAVKHASGDYLVIIDDFTKVQENWLFYLKKTFVDFPNTGLVCSKLINPITNKCTIGILSDQAEEISPVGYNRESNDPTINYVQEIDFATTSIMIPKNLWTEVGGMNTELPEFMAFLDLALKINISGSETRNQPNSEVISYRFNENLTSISNYRDRYPDLFKSLKKKSLRRKLSTTGNILYVDDRIPQPDKSAGGVYSFNLIRILKDLGFHVTFFPAWEQEYESSYIKNLQSIGVETFYHPFIFGLDKYIMQKGYQYDLIVLCRVSVASYYIHKIRKYAPQAKVVFNTIDLHFLRKERFAEISGSLIDKEEAEYIRKLELGAVSDADTTLVCSDQERTLLEVTAPSAKVSLIPIPVDIPGRLRQFDERQDIVFLGGYGHQPNVDAVKSFVKDIWPIILQHMPGVKFIIAGSNMPEEFSSLASDSVELRGFIHDLSELYSRCRLSVVPLRFGAGIKGKILTSMSFGVPNVITSIAAEGMQLISGNEVLIADNPSEFAAAVEKAYTQGKLWLELSDNGLRYLQEKFSLEAVRLDIEKLLISLEIIKER